MPTISTTESEATSKDVDSMQSTSLLHELFERTTVRFPDHVAVSCRGVDRSYHELDQASNRLARLLRDRGVRRGDHVAMLLPRSSEVYIAILAILKAGGTYVPLDPDYPVDRLRYILEDCQAKVIVTTASRAAELSGLRGEIVPLDALETELIAESSVRLDALESEVTAEDIAYVIYTSGSTGRPKGVEISHGSVCHLVRAEGEIFEVGLDDRVYQGFSIAFDASVEEVWLAFFSGATLVVGTLEHIQAGPGVARFLTESGVTVFSTVPTLLSMIEDDLPTVRLLILGGEPCPQDLVVRWCRPGLRLFNTYGPTEATVIATYAECDLSRPVSIGRAVPGYRIYLLDEHLKPVLLGASGEIHIGGPGLARGYLGNPEMTLEKFIANPFLSHDDPWPRLYKSGDLGRLNDFGEIEFVGRIDSQVKLRGFRIELAEIEAVLLEVPGVLTCAVTLREDTPGLPRLVGYLVLRNGSGLDPKALRESARKRLPAYMVPSHFEIVGEFPTLPSGKVDRRTLPPPRMRSDEFVVDEKALGGTELERSLAVTWGKLFAPIPVSVSDDFFLDLGGHSLLAARMVSELRADPAFQRLSVLDVYNHPTIETLAARIERFRLEQHEAQEANLKPRKPFHDSSDRAFRRCAAAQAAGLYVILGIFSLQWLAPYLTYTTMIEHNAEVYEAVLGSLGILLAVYPLMLSLTLAVKWLVVGRFKAGEYPLWGRDYYRWWFVNTFQSIVPIGYMAGTPLLSWYYRMMGAKIGANVHFGTSSLLVTDLASIGDDTSIGSETDMAGYTVEDGLLKLGSITVGRGCNIGNRCVIHESTLMEDGSTLDDLSLLSRGMRIPKDERWAGSPSRRVEQPRSATGTHKRPSLARRLLFGLLHGIGLFLFPVMVISAIFPGVMIMNDLNYRDDGYLYLLVSPFVALLFIVLLCLEIVAVKWLFLGRLKPGRYDVHSLFYLRKWFVDQLLELSLDVIGPLYATIYLNPFYKLLGAKLGRRAEISTASFISPDLLEIGEEGFIADAVSLGAAQVENGTIKIDRVKIGRRAFVGNSALLPPGARIGDNCLIGVLSTPPTESPGASAEGTSWLGSPAIFLPQRQESTVFDTGTTYNPTRKLIFQRAVIEFLRVTLPLSCFIALTCALLSVFLQIHDDVSIVLVVILFPFLYAVFGIAASALVVVAKWSIMGRYRAGEHPLWSPFVWGTELVTALYENLARLFLVDMLRGTPFLAMYLRLLGAGIGKRVFLNTAEFTEFDLVEIGDDAAVNEDVTLQTHLFEDRVMKMSTVKIGARCSVGGQAVVLYDTEMKEWSSLGSLSLLMKGETLPPGTCWEGSPARSCRNEITP